MIINEEFKKKIETAENNRGYVYYDFSPEMVERVIATPLKNVTNDELRGLIQMIYPDKLICSGFIDNVLIFDIVDGVRKDPPLLFYFDMCSPSDCKKIKGEVLYIKILNYIREKKPNAKFDQSWLDLEQRILMGEFSK